MVVTYGRRSLDYRTADEGVVAHQSCSKKARVAYNIEEKHSTGEAALPDVVNLAADGEYVLIAHHDFGDLVNLDRTRLLCVFRLPETTTDNDISRWLDMRR